MVVAQETTTPTTTALKTYLINAGIFILGSVILALHIFLYRYNMILFNLFVGFYSIGFGVFIAYMVNKYQMCFISNKSSTSYTVMIYLCLYTVFIETIMLIVMCYFYITGGKIGMGRYNNTRLNSRIRHTDEYA